MRRIPSLAKALSLGIMAVAYTAALAPSGAADQGETDQAQGHHWWGQQGRNSQYHLYTQGFWKAHFGPEGGSQGSTSAQTEAYRANPWSSNGQWREHWTPSWNDHWNDAWGEGNSGKTGSQMEEHSGLRSTSQQRQKHDQEQGRDQK